MTRPKNRKTKTGSRQKQTQVKLPLDPRRAGMPSPESITGVERFGRGKKVFTIIHTNEVDEYERAPSKDKRRKRGSNSDRQSSATSSKDTPHSR